MATVKEANHRARRLLQGMATCKCRRACLGMRRPNIWPEKHLPQLRLVFQALGQLMALVGERVAALCDLYMLQKVSLHD